MKESKWENQGSRNKIGTIKCFFPIFSQVYSQTSLCGHLYLADTCIYLSCLKKFHMNCTCFKRSPVLKDHFLLSQRWQIFARLPHVMESRVFFTVILATIWCPVHHNHWTSNTLLMYEKFEDTKEVIRNGKLKKVRQYNGQNKENQRTNNDLPHSSQAC
jgi:hypothetical protein